MIIIKLVKYVTFIMKKLTYSNIALQLFLGLIIADFISGILHWVEDNYIDYCTDLPIFKDIARDNEMHHYFPRSIIAYSNIEHTSYTLPFSMIFIICVNRLVRVKQSISYYGCIYLIIFSILYIAFVCFSYIYMLKITEYNQELMKRIRHKTKPI